MFHPRFDARLIVERLTGKDPITSLIRAVDLRLDALGANADVALLPDTAYAPENLGRIPTAVESRSDPPFPPKKNVIRDLQRVAYLLAAWMLRFHHSLSLPELPVAPLEIGPDGIHAVEAMQLLVSRARSGTFTLEALRQYEEPVTVVLKVPDGLDAVCHINAAVDLTMLLPPPLLIAVCVYAVGNAGLHYHSGVNNGTSGPVVPVNTFSVDRTQLPRFAEALLEASRRLPR